MTIWKDYSLTVDRLIEISCTVVNDSDINSPKA
jgi:hypothetical protein